MSLTKLSVARNNLITSGQGEFGDIPALEGESANFFTVCALIWEKNYRKKLFLCIPSQHLS
jgi:hypothetical protein